VKPKKPKARSSSGPLKPKKPKALVLFSGGLDSILTVKLLQEEGVSVRALHFTCPFYPNGWARRSACKLGIRRHEIPVDKAYFEMVARPPHGYGSQANPCIDCKVYMLRRAERLRRKLGLDFLATGEVVGERPMSQTRPSLIQTENLAGLSGKVVRPLSGGIMTPTQAEKEGLIKREGMLSISGRSRKPQMALARRFGIGEYPAPAGGCLLTDPEYARRIKEHISVEGRISWDEGELLKHGRHFRVSGVRVVVGRNEEDNESLLELGKRMILPHLEVGGHPGPLTLIVSRRPSVEVVEAAAGLTVRYSDAPGRARVEIRKGRSVKTVEAGATPKAVLDKMRI
jgi:tRNA-specific 2-thiouridylase